VAHLDEELRSRFYWCEHGWRSWMRNCAARSIGGSTGWSSLMRNCAERSIGESMGGGAFE